MYYDLKFIEKYNSSDKFKIDQIFSNFLEYGNCTFCVWDNLGYEAKVYELKFTEKGKIVATETILVFDSFYSTLNKDIESKEKLRSHITSIKRTDCGNYFEDPFALAYLIIYTSLHNDVFIKVNDNNKKIHNSKKTIHYLYDIMYPILKMTIDQIKDLATESRFKSDIFFASVYDQNASKYKLGNFDNIGESELLDSIHNLFYEFYDKYYEIKEADHTQWILPEWLHQQTLSEVIDELKDKYEKKSKLTSKKVNQRKLDI